LTKSLETFGKFFGINSDLVHAAAYLTAGSDYGEISKEEAYVMIEKMPAQEKISCCVDSLKATL